MKLIEFYKFIIIKYLPIWIPFVIGLGILIRAERGQAHEKGN